MKNDLNCRATYIYTEIHFWQSYLFHWIFLGSDMIYVKSFPERWDWGKEECHQIEVCIKSSIFIIILQFVLIQKIANKQSRKDMNPDTVLDYVIFQLSSTRTRYYNHPHRLNHLPSLYPPSPSPFSHHVMESHLI